MSPEVREVAAALIWRGEGKERQFMICRRPPEKARGLLWEFVGGKLEPGETGEEALVRECREELDVTVRPTGVFAVVRHEYPDITIRLTLYHTVIASGEPKLLEHVDLSWITPEEIPEYEFCPADDVLLEKITDFWKKELQMEEILQFLRKCGTYYLATVENGQPRVRPFGTVDIFDGRLTIQTGKIKPVSRQLHENPRCEICAFDGAQWLRLSAEAVEETRTEAAEQMLTAYPSLRAMYAPGDGNTEIFALTKVHAVFSSFTAAPKVIDLA